MKLKLWEYLFFKEYPPAAKPDFHLNTPTIAMIDYKMMMPCTWKIESERTLISPGYFIALKIGEGIYIVIAALCGF